MMTGRPGRRSSVSQQQTRKQREQAGASKGKTFRSPALKCLPPESHFHQPGLAYGRVGAFKIATQTRCLAFKPRACGRRFGFVPVIKKSPVVVGEMAHWAEMLSISLKI